MKRILFAALLFLHCSSALVSQIITGAMRTDAYFPLLRDHRIAVVANNNSTLPALSGNGTVNLIDTLVNSGYRVVKIFSPEHGFRGHAEAGELVADTADPATGIPVVSLYGNHKKPRPEELKGIELVIFDLQDVGVRFFTYLSTLAYVMESCAALDIPVLLLDRPNPNGDYIDGPVLEKEYASFVGLHPVPVVYGMTIGEYARMVNGEGWLNENLKCNLEVIPLVGYTHSLRVVSVGLPSPNLPTMNAIRLYPSLCFFEGTTVSVGRGTDYPFEVFGHPDLVTGSFSFVPRSMPGKSLHPPFEGIRCYGSDLRNKGFTGDEQGRINLSYLITTYKILGSKTDFFTSYFALLAGTDQLRQQIIQGLNEQEIRDSWREGIMRFKKRRSQYLLYPDN